MQNEIIGNPGTSLNFDAQQLYIEEDNELEQQDNELKNLIAKELANMDYEYDDDDDDDDDEGSSSSDLSYNEKQQQQQQQRRISNHHHHNRQQQQQHQDQLINTNNIQQYSTPAIGVHAPQLTLQQTIIPNINEDTIMYQNGQTNDNHHNYNENENQNVEETDDYHLHLDNDSTVNHIKPQLEDINGQELEFETLDKTPANQYNHIPQDIDSYSNDQDSQTILNDNDFMNLDLLRRKFGHLRILYNARGKKIEEVTARFEAFKIDTDSEVRAMKHRMLLLENDAESSKLSLQQSNELCIQYKQEIDNLNNHIETNLTNEIVKLKEINNELVLKIDNLNEEIESLNYQLNEQQKSDSLDRLKQQHELIVQKLRETHEQEIFILKENINKYEFELDEKINTNEMLKQQLEASMKQSEQQFIDKTETIQRLNKRINDIQKQYDDLMCSRQMNSIGKNDKLLYEQINYLETNKNERDGLIVKLQERNRELEENIRLLEAMQLCNNNNSGTTLSDSQEIGLVQNTESIQTLKKELERALNLIKTKRNDILKLQNEINRLKQELNLAQSQPLHDSDNQIPHLKDAIDNLTKEKFDLKQEVDDLKAKLEQLYSNEDEFQQIRQDLEAELQLKNEQLEEINYQVQQAQHIQISAKNNELEKQKLDLEIKDLKARLEQAYTDMQQIQQDYIDVCEERKTIEDKLKANFDKELRINLEQIKNEYESQLKKKDYDYLVKQEAYLELSKENEQIKFYFEEEKKRLNDDFESLKVKFDVELRKNETHKAEICDLNERLNQILKEKQVLSEKLDQIQTMSQNSNELNQQVALLQSENNELKSLRDTINQDKFKLNELSQKLIQLEAENNELKSLRDRLDVETQAFIELNLKFSQLEEKNNELNKIKSKFEDLKTTFDLNLQKMTQLEDENDSLKLNNQNYTKLKTDFEDFKKLLENEKQSNSDLTRKLVQLQSERDNLNKRLQSESENAKRLQLDLDELRTKFDEEKELSGDLTAKMCTIQHENDDLKRKSLNKYDYDKLKVSLENEKKTNESLTVKIKELQRDLEETMRRSTVYSDEKYEALKTECDKYKNDSIQLKAEKDEICKRLSKELETKLNEELSKLTKIKHNLETQFKQRETEFNNESEKLNSKLNEIIQKYESSKINWETEKNHLIAQKDEEYQNIIDDLNRRFEEDYSKFLQSSKENLAKTLNEKTEEFSREKQKYEQICEDKLKEFETKEMELNRQIKDLKRKIQIVEEERESKMNSLDINEMTCASERQYLPHKMANKTQDELRKQISDNENNWNQEREALLAQIKSLEEVLSSTDAHFEMEIEKLKNDLEIEYRGKLEDQVKNLQLEHESEIESLKKCFNDSYENDKRTIKNDKSNKYQQELRIRDKQLETIEQAYKAKVEDMQNELMKWEIKMEEMREQNEKQVNKVRKEIDDQYKGALSRQKQENENLQVFIQKLKKTNTDSDKVIKNLKEEMSKMQAIHLDDITNLKLNSERENESLIQKIEQLAIQLQKAEKIIQESDDKHTKDIESMKTKLKQEYGQELSRMNSRMKEQQKSHTEAIETLKKQYTVEKFGKNFDEKTKKSLSYAKTCQTDVSYQDIAVLEAIREKYLETLHKMKAEMMKQFDEQTARKTEKFKQELEEERKRMKDRIRSIFMKKISFVLQEHRVGELSIKKSLNDLDNELNNVLDNRVVNHDHVDHSSTLNTSKRPLSAHSSSSSTALEVRNIIANLNKQQSSLHKIQQSDSEYDDTSSLKMTNDHSINSSSQHYQTSNYVRKFKPNSGDTFRSQKSNKDDDQMKDLQQFLSKSQTRLGNEGGESSPKVTSNYKYTPLRQSWSNLSQLNQLTAMDLNDDRSQSPYTYERPISASSIQAKSSTLPKKTSDKPIVSSLSDTKKHETQLRSYGSNILVAKPSDDSPPTSNKFSSLPKNSSTSRLGASTKTLTQSRPTSAASNPFSGLSLFKQESQQKPNIQIDYDNYDDTMPVKELDCTTTTSTSSIKTNTSNLNKFQPIKSQVPQSASYRQTEIANNQNQQRINKLVSSSTSSVSLSTHQKQPTESNIQKIKKMFS